MKKLMALSLAALLCETAFAASNPVSDGYYRARNRSTYRYVYVMDSIGSIDYDSYEPDLSCFNLYNYGPGRLSDPSTVIYIQKADTDDNKYDYQAQGIDLFNQLAKGPYGGKYGRISSSKNGGFYSYANWPSPTLVVSYFLKDDEQTLSKNKAPMSYTTLRNADNSRVWDLVPIDAETSEYFGFKPTIALADGSFADVVYLPFPFSVYNPGSVKIYYVPEIKGCKICLKEWTDEIVPAFMPVLIMCKSRNPYDNRINVGYEIKHKPQPARPRNFLRGTIFDSYRVYKGFVPTFQRVICADDNHNLVFKSTYKSNTVEQYAEVTRTLTPYVPDYIFENNVSYLSLIDPDKEEPIVMVDENGNLVYLDPNTGEVVDIKDYIASEVLEIFNGGTPTLVDEDDKEIPVDEIYPRDEQPETTSDEDYVKPDNTDPDSYFDPVVGIEAVENESAAAAIYSLFGVKMESEPAAGAYIKNGEKVIIAQ